MKTKYILSLLLLAFSFAGFGQTCLCGAALSTTTCVSQTRTTNVNAAVTGGNTRNVNVGAFSLTNPNSARNQNCSVSTTVTVNITGIVVGTRVNVTAGGSTTSVNYLLILGGATINHTFSNNTPGVASPTSGNITVSISNPTLPILGINFTITTVTATQTFCYAVCPLSLDLMRFTGKATPNKNMLNWVTDNEFDNDKHVIQKWTKRGYETIGEVKAKNETSNSYDFIDTDLEGEASIYKLLTIENDGHVIESEGNVISVQNIIETKNIIKVYDLLGKEVNELYRGPCIFVYEDNTTQLGYQ